MPPALVAELEDVAVQLARLCGELGVRDDEDGDGGEYLHDNKFEHDDGKSIEHTQEMGVDGDHESLVSSLVEATSECEALMKLLGEDCDSLSNESGDEPGDGSTNEDQIDIQLQKETACTRARGNGHEFPCRAMPRDCCSDELDSRREDGIMSVFNAFASDLEALSSLMVPRGDNLRGHQDVTDASDNDSPREKDDDNGSSSELREENRGEKVERYDATISRYTEGTMTTMVGGSIHAPSLRTVQAAILQQHKAPVHPKKYRSHRGSFNHLLRLRTRKKASTRDNDLKRRATVGASTTNEAYWNDFQRKSFARHISRQELARLRVLEEQATEERLVAARFQHSATLNRNQQAKGAKQERVTLEPKPVTKAEDRSYLDDFFHRQEPKSGAAASDIDYKGTRDKDAMTRVLCGVYIYGHRHDSVVYMTFASMAQFRERIASRLGVKPIVNLYRERCTMTASSTSVQPRYKGKKQFRPTRLLQRVSSFDQIADGDVLCVTKDAYEDMAILCEWMTERRQQPSPARASPARPTRSMVTPRSAQCKQTPSNAVPALRRMVEGDAVRSNRPKTCISPLWDCNGRNIRVGDAAYRISSTPSDSTRTKLVSENAHRPRTRK